MISYSSLFFFFNDTATTEIYTLSLHDALPIFVPSPINGITFCQANFIAMGEDCVALAKEWGAQKKIFFVHFRDIDRKSTRLNSSHANISYAVFCLKKKKKNCTNYGSIHQIKSI